MKNIAIVLAAGQGKRMQTLVPKQFLQLGKEPMLLKSLKVFEKSDIIDEIVLVAAKDYLDECRKLVKKNDIHKVKKIVTGGSERYESVYEGLKVCSNCRYVFIHDSARPYVDKEIIRRAYYAVKENPAVAVGMPSKDTIKIIDEDGYVKETPPRASVWIIQTPQVFRYELIKEAYDRRLKEENGMEGITDDAMVMERSGLSKVTLVEGSYANIKITTPDDMTISDKDKKRIKDKDKDKDKEKDKKKEKKK